MLIVLTSSDPDFVYPADQLMGLPQQAQICERRRQLCLLPPQRGMHAAAAAYYCRRGASLAACVPAGRL